MIKASALRVCTMENERDTNLSLFRMNNQNILIDDSEKDTVIPSSIENLAYRMMTNDVLIKDYLVTLRENYTAKREDFHFSLSGKSDFEKKVIIELFQDMYGIVTLLHYCPECEMLNGRISLAPKAQRFILGQYMEIALYKQVRDVLADISKKYGKDFAIYKNVKVSTREGKLKNEFDIVIESSDGIVYVIESKTEKRFRDLEKYSQIGRKYGIVPDRFLLISNAMSAEQCEIAQFFCEYLVCNLEGNSFVEKLTAMVEKDI